MIAAILALTVTCFSPDRISDGDTFRCGTERVRLFGVDTPETKHGRTPAQPYAYEAKDRLHELTRGKVECVEAGNRRDRFGRMVARCSGLVSDIGAEMVRGGYATDWPKFSKGEYQPQEREARAHRRGRWR